MDLTLMIQIENLHHILPNIYVVAFLLYIQENRMVADDQ
jgi:hypothetical protein